MAKVVQFIKESKAELKQVVISSIKVVIVSTLVVAVVLGLLDFGFTEAFRALMK